MAIFRAVRMKISQKDFSFMIVGNPIDFRNV
jgi:hypothetical protein